MNCFETLQFQGREWLLYRFYRAEAEALFSRAMRIRTDVFVEEQAVPAEHELDILDDSALHFLLCQNEGEGLPVATGRMFPAKMGSLFQVKIGRMAVGKAYRGGGFGKLLLENIINTAQAEGYEEAVLDAQTHALGFYAGLGFVAEGTEFMDENIPHFKMKRFLK